MSDTVQHIDIEVMQEPEPSSFKLIFALGLAGFFSGVLLVSTYLWTKPMIEANKAAALQEAIFKVLPGCTDFRTLELIDGQLKVKADDPGQGKAEDSKETLMIYQGLNTNGEQIGYAIPGQVAGFQDIIGALFGYDPTTDAIIGFEVLESKETPGLGDKIFKDKDFQSNFEQLITSPEIIAVKKGEKSKENEVETISGATISSKAVVRLLNEAMAEWREYIVEYEKTNITEQ